MTGVTYHHSGTHDFDSVTTEEQAGSHSVLIDSVTKLENLDSNLSQGDVALVEQPATPYRTSSWIDIDTQDVTVAFESQWAKDGEPIVKPSDGADVGGVRIGNSTQADGVTVINFGFHGNESTMTGSVKRLHGVNVVDAKNFHIHRAAATKTHPYHEHGTGGSGISAGPNATDGRITQCFTDDIGDRGIQVAGKRVSVVGSTLINGYDRGVSLNANYSGSQTHAEMCMGMGNTAYNNSDGSGFGAGQFCTWVGNTAISTRRLMSKPQQSLVVGNVGKDLSIAGYYDQTFRNIVVGNYIENPAEEGINTGAGGSVFACNLVKDAGKHGIKVRDVGVPVAIIGNLVMDSDQNNGGNDEIWFDASGGGLVSGNIVPSRGGSTSFAEGSNAAGVLWTGNKAPDDGNAWNLQATDSRAKANFPTHYDLDEVLTGITGSGNLTSAISRASLGDDIEVRATPNADPDNDIAFQAHPVWDDSAGSVKAAVEELIGAGGGDVRVTAKVQ